MHLRLILILHRTQFSDTYKFELHWLRNFLFLFAFLFVYDFLQLFTEGFITELHWTQEWWFEFFSLLVVIYVGVKGYFTKIEDLPRLEPEILYAQIDGSRKNETPPENYDQYVESVIKMVEEEELYLDPDLTLTTLARKLKMAPSQLSAIINKGLSQNFNMFINTYRVRLIKEKLMSDKYDHLSILAIALDSGFNSKATFNRVFKKIDCQAPSFYRN